MKINDHMSYIFTCDLSNQKKMKVIPNFLTRIIVNMIYTLESNQMKQGKKGPLHITGKSLVLWHTYLVYIIR